MAELLTLGTLRKYIPEVQSGDPARREAAQLGLLKASDKLLWKWSHAEFARARQQVYVASVEDVHGLIVLHFLAALDHVDINKLNSSATNYLYHHSVSRTRREINATYGNVKFSNEFLESSRRAKAIQSRLIGDLGRMPSDEEIIETSKQATPGIHMGPLKSSGQTTRKPLSASFMKSWRQNSHLLEMGEMPTDDALYGYTHQFDDSESTEGLRKLFLRTAELGGISKVTIEVIFAAHGIGPYGEPKPVEEIAETTGMTVAKTKRIIKLWLEMCKTPGSPFHRAISELDNDESVRLGISAVAGTLGPYRSSARIPVPDPLRPA